MRKENKEDITKYMKRKELLYFIVLEVITITLVLAYNSTLPILITLTILNFVFLRLMKSLINTAAKKIQKQKIPGKCSYKYIFIYFGAGVIFLLAPYILSQYFFVFKLTALGISYILNAVLMLLFMKVCNDWFAKLRKLQPKVAKNLILTNTYESIICRTALPLALDFHFFILRIPQDTYFWMLFVYFLGYIIYSSRSSLRAPKDAEKLLKKRG
ncbi:MAG: hypothetical protein KAK00_02565 [Nanoarchaeota archaeon]|nr:hypothetical protein [Nanoarchaeota archaeon]